MQKVPAGPECVQLYTGDRIRLEVEVDRTGYVTVFNVGPTGNLNLLCPVEPGDPPPLLLAHRRMHLLDLEMTLPAGSERLFAVWTREPLPLHLDELRSLAGPKVGSGTDPYDATRDMMRVGQSLEQLDREDYRVVVMALEHV
jgi:hypothetical protein